MDVLPLASCSGSTGKRFLVAVNLELIVHRRPRLDACGHNATGDGLGSADWQIRRLAYCGVALRRRRTARPCTGISRAGWKPPYREGPRQHREGDNDVEFCARRGPECVRRTGETEYAVSVGLLFWRIAGRRRIASIVSRGAAADFKASPVRTAGCVGNKATGRNRQRHALQHKRKDHDRSGKLLAIRSPQSP
jgi:hypothetical protein